jgi:hypothetical protein
MVGLGMQNPSFCTILPLVLLFYGAYSGSVFTLMSATSHQPPVTSQSEVLLSHNKSVPVTRHSQPNKIRTERGGEGE